MEWIVVKRIPGWYVWGVWPIVVVKHLWVVCPTTDAQEGFPSVDLQRLGGDNR